MRINGHATGASSRNGNMKGKVARGRFFSLWVSLAVAALGVLSAAAWAEESFFILKDVALVGAQGHAVLKLTFDGRGMAGGYPLYFQKADSAKGTVTLSFLETETAFPLGRHSLPVNSPAVEELLLRKITSPSGKNFLGVEIKLKTLPSGDLLVEPMPKGILNVTVGPAARKKSSWSLSASVKSKDDHLSVKAETPPVSSAAAGPTASIPVKETTSAARIPVSTPVSAPAPQTNSNPTPSVASEAQSGSVVTPKDSVQGAEPPEPIKSAQAEGAALDARHAVGGGKGAVLSSSKIFTVGGAGKAMVFMRDSTALLDAPGPKGKPGRKIALGAKIDKLESKGGWLRVASGPDTGYIKAGTAVYADEMTPTLENSLQAKQQALAKAQASKEARAAAALAKAEDKKKQAEMAAQIKAQRDSAKALAKASKDSAAAAAKLVAAKAKADKLAQKQARAQSAAQSPDQAPVEGASVQAKGGAPSTQGGNGVAGQAVVGGASRLAIADNPELADKLAREKQQAENEKLRVEPEENRVTYNSYGRRDPFIPVEQGASDNGIDIDQMKVVGIIWQGAEPLAVLEHNREAGVSFTVKQGDPVHNGRVARITRDAVTFDISEYGISRSYSLKLVSNKVEGAKK